MKTGNRSFLLTCLVLLSGFFSNASAGLVTGISGLNIGGKSYDVTFHPGKSFKQLWDADGDFDFTDNDGSLFNVPPAFWGDFNGAKAARDALIAWFPDDGSIGILFNAKLCPPTGYCDSFLIPYMHESSTIFNTFDGSPLAQVDTTSTSRVRSRPDGIYYNVYASFSPTLSNVPVPLPATLPALVFGLAALGWCKRKRAR